MLKIVDHCVQLNEKILVFSSFIETLDLTEKLIKNKMKYFRIDGQTPEEKRFDAITKFNDENNTTPLFLLSTKAGGVGINLTGANRVISFDVDWNPATYRKYNGK